MKTLVALFAVVLTKTAAAAPTVCTIKRLNAPEPSAPGVTLFSDQIKDEETFLLKKRGPLVRDFDLFRAKNYLQLRSLDRAKFIVISRPSPGAIAISLGQYDVGAKNALPILAMTIGAEAPGLNLDLPASRLSIHCAPVAAAR